MPLENVPTWDLQPDEEVPAFIGWRRSPSVRWSQCSVTSSHGAGSTWLWAGSMILPFLLVVFVGNKGGAAYETGSGVRCC